MIIELASPNKWWESIGFVVAAVGTTAKRQLDKGVFSINDFYYCAPLICFNMPVSENEYSHCLDKSERAKEFNNDIDMYISKCNGKHLFVISDLDDVSVADSCCQLANSTGENGYSILITHMKNTECTYYENIKAAFNHVIIIPDSSQYPMNIVKWIICDFAAPGYVGVDIADALYILSLAKKSFCIRDQFKNYDDVKRNIENLSKRGEVKFDKKHEMVNGLLGLQVPHDINSGQIDEVYTNIRNSFSGDFVITVVPNEDEKDNSWTIFLLTSLSLKDSGIDIDKILEEINNKPENEQ